MTQARLEQEYEAELAAIRELAREFARDRPKIAPRLGVSRETGESSDPHVERLLQAFAFLTARIQLKLKDEFPELTDDLLATLYPHYLAPIPSAAIVQLVPDKLQGVLLEGKEIPTGTEVYSSEVDGVRCRFRTTAPVTLWPLDVSAAKYERAPFGRDVAPQGAGKACDAAIRITVESTTDEPLNALSVDRLRFYLNAEEATARLLYERIFHDVAEVLVRSADGEGPQQSVSLAPDRLVPVGFDRAEELLPRSARSFRGYLLLTEYFALPSKFLFFDLQGLAALRHWTGKRRFEIVLFLRKPAPFLEPRVKRDTFRLGCCPMINLFSFPPPPIDLRRTRTEYRIVPDQNRASFYEVYSVDEVESVHAESRRRTHYRPFYELPHAGTDATPIYWRAVRRRSLSDDATDVYLSLVDLNFDPQAPEGERLELATTCSNRDLPYQLAESRGGADWGFRLTGQSPVKSVSLLLGPTKPVRLDEASHRWRLLGHLALNHLSLSDHDAGGAALRELLQLYGFVVRDQAQGAQKQIDGVVDVSSRPMVAPVTREEGTAVCRGVEVTITFDEKCYEGGGFFLLATVLDRFLGLYTSVNSFTRLVAVGRPSGQTLYKGAPRAGDRPLI